MSSGERDASTTPARWARLLAPPGCEKTVQQSGALLHQHATKDIHAMIHRWHREDIGSTARGARLRIPGAKHEPCDACVHDGRGAHHAGLERDVQRGAI